MPAILNQDGDFRHLENHFFDHNSSTDCAISAKLCTRNWEAARHADKGHVTKTAIFFKNPTWRTATILKIIKSPYLSEKNVRFWWNLVHYSRYWTRWQSRDKKIEIVKIQDGGGRHLENRMHPHNSSTDCPISAKCCTRTNGMQRKATWQKLQFF